MPQVEEYLPTVETQGPVGAVSPNTEFAGAPGRALEDVGQSVEHLGDAIYRRDEQQEVAQSYNALAHARADWTVKMQQRLAAGTLDTEELEKQYDDYIAKSGQNISTAGGAATFNRLAERLKGTLLSQAVHMQAEIQGQKARALWEDTNRQDSMSVYNSPDQFDDTRQASVEAVDQMIKAAPKLAGQRDTLLRQKNELLAMSAIRGWTDMQPDGPVLAKQMVDAGTYDNFLTGEQKAAAYKHIEQAKDASISNQERLLHLHKELQEQKAEAIMRAWIPKIVNKTLSPLDVAKASPDLKFGQAEQVLNYMKSSYKGDGETDPRVYTRLFQRINADDDDPDKITSVTQIGEHVGKDLSIPHFDKLVQELQKTPEFQESKENRNKLIEYAKSQLQYPSMDPMSPGTKGGTKDVASFIQALQGEENRRTRLQEPLAPLYKTDGKDSFYNQVEAFKATPEERMRGEAHAIKQEATPPMGQTIRNKKTGQILNWNPQSKKYEFQGNK